jgi:tetratricopeptide (TPR) repeat protein/transcriptional regulator with XRE-family HTH domain
MVMRHTLPFAALLRRYRLAAGLTQEALAARAGLSVRGISDLERGVRHAPYQDTVSLLAAALALTTQEQALFERASGRWRSSPATRSSTSARSTSEAQLAPGLATPPFVGRRAELALLARHLAGEEPPLLLLAGEPGIGKTRLLREAAARGREAGWSVLEGGCQRRGGQDPYAPLLHALEGRLGQASKRQARADLTGCAWLVRLLPELAETTVVPAPRWALPPEQERRLMFQAVGRFLTNVSGPSGVLLVLDDVQWAGPDALDLLATLLRAPAEGPLRVVAAYRDTEIHPDDPLAGLLADLARDGAVTQHGLSPLAPHEAAELFESLFDRLLEGSTGTNAAVMTRLLERTGGVPFYIVSCAQAVEVGGVDAAGAVPWDVAQTLRLRLAALPPQAQAILETAALIGRTAPRSLLNAVAMRQCQARREAQQALDALCHARVLMEEGEDAYQFAHDLIRETIVGNLSAARRALLHLEVAVALEGTPGAVPIEQLAYHYAHSEDLEKAALYLERAGDKAWAMHAHAEAEQAYRALVARLDVLGRAHAAAAAREKLGRELNSRGRYDAAIAVLQQAQEAFQVAADQDGRARVLAQLGRAHTLRGTFQEGIALLQREALNPASLTPETRPTLPAALMFLYVRMRRYREALAAAEEAARYAREAHDTKTFLLAEVQRGYALGKLGRLEDAVSVLDEALRHAEQSESNLESTYHALNNLSVTHTYLGHYEQALIYAERALATAVRLGDATYVMQMHNNAGSSTFLLGAWAKARTYLEHAVNLAREIDPSIATPYPIVNLGILCRAEGQTVLATRYFSEGLALVEHTRDMRLVQWIQQELAEGDLLAGNPAAARERLEPFQVQSEHGAADALEFLPYLAWSYSELGDLDRAQSLAAQGVQRARAAEMRPALVDALRIAAMIAAGQGRWVAAKRALVEALKIARALPSPYAEAKVLYTYGLLYKHKGEPQQAHERLDSAVALCASLGERLYAEHIERALAELGC